MKIARNGMNNTKRRYPEVLSIVQQQQKGKKFCIINIIKEVEIDVPNDCLFSVLFFMFIIISNSIPFPLL